MKKLKDLKKGDTLWRVTPDADNFRVLLHKKKIASVTPAKNEFSMSSIKFEDETGVMMAYGLDEYDRYETMDGGYFIDEKDARNKWADVWENHLKLVFLNYKEATNLYNSWMDNYKKAGCPDRSPVEIPQ